jgi:K+-transporting ATPase A subunit
MSWLLGLSVLCAIALFVYLVVALLIGTVLLVGLLTFVPALALGPIVEHLLPGSR